MIGLKEPPDRPQMTAKRERSTFKKRGHLRQTSGSGCLLRHGSEQSVGQNECRACAGSSSSSR